jgi:DNA-binding NtrC family response regulator
MSGARSSADGGPATPAASTIVIPPGGAKLQQLEREIFLKTLALAGDNQSRAARILGLRESTFRFRLQKLGIASRRRMAVPLGRVAMFLGTASLTTLAVSVVTGC